MTEISLIHPSRSRPLQARAAYDEWVSNMTGNHSIEYLVSLDTDDDTEAYMEAFESAQAGFLINANRSIVDAVNKGGEASQGNLLIVVSDDFGCFKGWDEKLLYELKGEKDYCVKTFDGAEEWILTLPICDRAYYNRFGYIYYPEYRHMFCDTEMTNVAMYLDCIIDLKHLYFEHRHPANLKGQSDSLYQRNYGSWEQGEKLYIERFLKDFDLPKEEIVQRFDMLDKGHIRHLQWLTTKGVRW